MNKLMNSAMMPAEGTYQLWRVAREDFVNRLQSRPFESYIGYPETANFLESVSGMRISVSREQTTLVDGDTLLIVKLKYRLQNPAQKKDWKPSAEDYEFFVCGYSA